MSRNVAPEIYYCLVPCIIEPEPVPGKPELNRYDPS